jgi:hypothetical protein
MQANPDKFQVLAVGKKSYDKTSIFDKKKNIIYKYIEQQRLV